MKILGDEIFARNEDGSLKSHVGTVFFRTPGIVTIKGVHATQRLAWIEELNRERAEKGEAPLTDSEAEAEWADSVDILFTDRWVLIRPEANRMDLAFKADEVLQKFVSKRKIRFLHTNMAKVRDALRARGENWRMSRIAMTNEELDQQIESSRTSIENEKIYFYNHHTGTRYVSAGALSKVAELADDKFRPQVAEIVAGMKSYNRLGQQEIDVFPLSMPAEIRSKFRSLNLEDDDVSLRKEFNSILLDVRMALPADLRNEVNENFSWRNELCATLSRTPNETTVRADELIQGISPEFYRQIEWLPGGRLDNGRLVFDSIFDEAMKSDDADLKAFCDLRVRSLIFNCVRMFDMLEYINVGKIARPLVRHPNETIRRSNVYIVQYKLKHEKDDAIVIVRFQKWGVAEHLNEGKDLLQAGNESINYADYILDRRLGCRQLGMKLPPRVTLGQITERYDGANIYNGMNIRSFYYVRDYVKGTASDKIPPPRFSNPVFAKKFAELMGEAAAVDLIVGRAITETGETVFDTNYEVVQMDDKGLPQRVVVTDHAGSFVKYLESLVDLIKPYARVVTRRKDFVSDFKGFSEAYISAFERKLHETKEMYLSNKRIFDDLFIARPYDSAGSGAFRWKCVLDRLAASDIERVIQSLRESI
jgi:hypothetical protein